MNDVISLKEFQKQRKQSEKAICIEFYKLLQEYIDFGLANWDIVICHHSPNGGYRNAKEAGTFKRMGVVAGFWDYLIIYGNEGQCATGVLFAEAKTPEGRLSENQKIFHSQINALGIPSFTFTSAKEGIDRLIQHGILSD